MIIISENEFFEYRQMKNTIERFVSSIYEDLHIIHVIENGGIATSVTKSTCDNQTIYFKE